MRAGERKARAIMIERCRLPGDIAMATLAIVRIVAGHVIGIGRILKIGLMAREAIFRRSSVLAIGVTACAIHSLMRAHQRKRRTIVIECRRPPRATIVAD